MLARLGALTGALAAACLLVAGPASAEPACGWSGYSYAGVESRSAAHGIAATVTMLPGSRVERGHTAGWVGVGGAGFGPGGSDVWLQVGLSAFPDRPAELYYEYALPGAEPTYVAVAPILRGRRYRVAILEARGRPGWWRVFVNGWPVSRPIFLPGSRQGWQPIATAESWDGGAPTCNRFRYRFERVRIATRRGGEWRGLERGAVLQDPGYVVRRTPTAFVARALV